MSKPFTHLCHVCGNGIPHDADAAGKMVSCPYCAVETELGKTYSSSTAEYENPWDQTEATSPEPVSPVHEPPVGGLASGFAAPSLGVPPLIPQELKKGPWGSMTGLGLGLGLGGLAAIGILFLGFLVVRTWWSATKGKEFGSAMDLIWVFVFLALAICIVLFVAGAVGVAIFKCFVVSGVVTDMARGKEDRKNVGLAGLGFFVAVAAGFLIYKQFFVSFAFMMACAGGLLGVTQWFLNARTLRTPEGVFCLFVASANLVLCVLSF
jgi:hypothetical protein